MCFARGGKGGGGVKEKRVGGDVTASGALPSFTHAPLPCDTSGHLVARGRSSPGCSPAARWSVRHCSNSRGRSQRVSLQQQQGPLTACVTAATAGAAHNVCHCSNSRGRSQRVSLQQQRGPLTVCVTAATAGAAHSVCHCSNIGGRSASGVRLRSMSLHQRVSPQSKPAPSQSQPLVSQLPVSQRPVKVSPQSKSAPDKVKVSPQSKPAPSQSPHKSPASLPRFCSAGVAPPQK